MTTIVEAIRSLCPTAEFSIVNSSYDQLTWLTPSIRKPSEIEVQLELKRLQDLEKLNEYKKLRAAAYPPIKDQLVMLYWDKVNGTNNWQIAIEAVKQQYPKPEGL